MYVNLGTGVVYGGDAEGDRIVRFEHLRGSHRGDTLIGDHRDNWLDGKPGDDRIEGMSGDDTIRGAQDADYLDGGPGTGDFLYYTRSPEGVAIDLGSGTAAGGHAQGDTIIGFEHVLGSSHGDTLAGDGQPNRLEGAAGADHLEGRAGADTLLGGEGEDTISYADSGAAVVVDLSTSVVSGGHAEGDTVSGVEHIEGSDHADTLTGDASGNTVQAGKGADRVDGGRGNDRVEGGDGADTLAGGVGQDTLDYGSSDAGVSVDLSTRDASGGHATGDAVTGFEHLVGSQHADTLVGDASANALHGGAGADSLDGGAGADTLLGGQGADRIDGGEGADSLSGGAGSDADTLVYDGSNAAVSVSLVAGTASGGDAEGDTLSGFEHLQGSSFNDSLTGDAGSNAIDGGAGADTLAGGQGMDTLDYSRSTAAVSVDLSDHSASGGHATGDVISGFEHVVGSRYDDTLGAASAGGGLSGGGGNDRFVFSAGRGEHTIADFEDGDLIVFASTHEVRTFSQVEVLSHDKGTLLKFSGTDGNVLLLEVEVGTVGETDFVF